MNGNRKCGKVLTKGSRFEYEDGTPYIPFGTTVYALLYQPEYRISETLETLRISPFNKIRFCIFPKYYEYVREEPDVFPFEIEGNKICVDRPVEIYWKRLETVLDELEEMGVQADLILFHPYDKWGFAHLTMSERKKYLSYIIQRISARKNVWWSLANEYDVMYDFKEEDWRELESFLADNDTQKHLISCHNWQKFYDSSHDTISHVSIQSCWYQEAGTLMKRYGKPVIYDEMGYEGNLQQNWGNLSAFEVVNRFWCVYTQGAYASHGETYYAEHEVLWWAKGGRLKGESPRRIQWLKEILESFPGALSPIVSGYEQQGSVDTQEDNSALLQKLMQLPESIRGFAFAMTKLTEKEKEKMLLADPQYFGHFKEKVYLRYFARSCPSICSMKLPKAGCYSVEVLDVWEMTRTQIYAAAEGEIEVRLPAKEGIAVLACQN